MDDKTGLRLTTKTLAASQLGGTMTLFQFFRIDLFGEVCRVRRTTQSGGELADAAAKCRQNPLHLDTPPPPIPPLRSAQ